MATDRREDIRARRNTPLVHVFEVTDADGAPVDLTGHSAIMQVRLYGMQPGDPLLDLDTVETAQTHGITLSGSEVTVYGDRVLQAFMPVAPVAGRDVRFAYDLILTDTEGYSWVERYGTFDLADGVTSDDETFLITDTGAVLTTGAGAYIEAV